MTEPKVIAGGIAVDDRGTLTFANDFDFKGVKRFYMIKNHRVGFVRAWHGHKKESKYVLAARGSFIIAAVKIDNWEKPSKDLEVHRFLLSANKPSVIFIPAGFANGFKSLTEDAQLMFFSTTSLEESSGDDFRFDAHYWNPWDVEER